MTEETIIAGFGGQGVLTMGMVLAYAGMVEELEVSWMPSYGPEMRGGTANCITILSDRAVSSPIITRFDTAVILNQPSLEKFEAAVKPGGLLLYESNNILNPPTRDDISVVPVPAAVEAAQLDDSRALNMIMLGAYLVHRPLVKLPSIMAGLEQVLPTRYHHLLPLNQEAIERGMKLTSDLIESGQVGDGAIT